MSSVGIQSLLLSLLGIHSALAHHEIMGLLAIARGLGASYRFAASEPGAGVFYGRVTLSFCRLVAGGIARYASMESLIDLPGLDFVALARGMGCAGQRVGPRARRVAMPTGNSCEPSTLESAGRSRRRSLACMARLQAPHTPKGGPCFTRGDAIVRADRARDQRTRAALVGAGRQA